MSFDITTTAGVVKTHLEGLGVFFKVDIARPMPGRPQGPYAVIYPESMAVLETTLTNTVERHVLRIEVHVSPTASDHQEAVLKGARIVQQVIDACFGDFTLGGNVRNVDVSGVEVAFVERDEAEAPTHVADITLPLIVDGEQAFAA